MASNDIQPTLPATPEPTRPHWQQSALYRYRHPIALAILLFIVSITIYSKGTAIMQVLENRDTLEAFVEQLGFWGPLALIAINILQIIVAPIPGYAVYLVAGYLFGPLMGGIWGSIGMLLGGMLAMGLARKLGRPIVQRIIGVDTLNRWEDVTRSESILVWTAILLSPIGDVPFLMAGLARVSYSKIFMLTVLTRIPAAFVAAAVGSGALHLSLTQIALLTAGLAIPLVILYRYQEVLLQRVEAFVKRQA